MYDRVGSVVQLDGSDECNQRVLVSCLPTAHVCQDVHAGGPTQTGSLHRRKPRDHLALE